MPCTCLGEYVCTHTHTYSKIHIFQNNLYISTMWIQHIHHKYNIMLTPPLHCATHRSNIDMLNI